MTGPLNRGFFKSTLGLLFWSQIVAHPTILRAQPGPEVAHAGLECIPSTQFSILSASIRPTDEIKIARVYFRSDKFPDFYYVDMAETEDVFRAILPKPSQMERDS